MSAEKNTTDNDDNRNMTYEKDKKKVRTKQGNIVTDEMFRFQFTSPV